MCLSWSANTIQENRKGPLRVLENLKEERYSNRTHTVCLGEKADEREGQRKVKVKDK